VQSRESLQKGGTGAPTLEAVGLERKGWRGFSAKEAAVEDCLRQETPILVQDAVAGGRFPVLHKRVHLCEEQKAHSRSS